MAVSYQSRIFPYNAAERLTQYSSTPQGQSAPGVQASYGFNPTAAQAGLWNTNPMWLAEANSGSPANAAAKRPRQPCPQCRYDFWISNSSGRHS